MSFLNYSENRKYIFLRFRGKSLFIDIGQTSFRISAKLWEVVNRPKNYAVNIIWSQQLLSGRHAIDFNSQIIEEDSWKTDMLDGETEEEEICRATMSVPFRKLTVG